VLAFEAGRKKRIRVNTISAGIVDGFSYSGCILLSTSIVGI
jgi:enoyl-[acyl-carrier-protein] reductase (NADH)